MEPVDLVKPVHADPELCSFLLGSVKTAFNLNIIESKIHKGGSGIATTLSIPLGAEIFRSKEALWVVPENGEIDKTCDNCFSNTGSMINRSGQFYTTKDEPVLNLMACNGCKLVRYCSKSCQKLAWRDHHKHECNYYLNHRTISPSGRLLTRMLNKFKNQQLSLMQQRSLLALKSCVIEHLNSPNKTEIIGFASTAMQSTAVDMQLGKVMKLYCQIITNMMGVHAVDQVIGVILDPFASLMNHSCVPNAFVFCEGTQLRVRTLRPIAAGDEIMISYINESYDYEFRQKRLKSNYFFACEKCLKNDMGKGTLPENSPSQPHDLEDVQKSLLAFHDNRLQGDRLEPLGVKIEEMASIGKRAFPKTGWPDHVQPVPDILNTFAMLYRLENELEQSLRLYLKLCFIISPSITISSHPEWFHLLFKLQVLLGLIVNESEIRSPLVATLLKANLPLRKIYEACLNQATAAAAGTYGADSAFAIAAKQFWTRELKGRPRRNSVNNYEFISRFQKEFSALFQWAGLG